MACKEWEHRRASSMSSRPRTGGTHDLSGGAVERQLPCRQPRIVEHLLVRRWRSGGTQQRRQERNPACGRHASLLTEIQRLARGHVLLEGIRSGLPPLR